MAVIPALHRTVLLLVLLTAGCAASVAHLDGPLIPVPASEVRYRKEVFRNDLLTAFLLEIPPQHATVMHRHDRDLVAVFVNGGRTISTLEGRPPVVDEFAVGEVRFRAAGFTHATHNRGSDVFRSVILEFADAQGAVDRTPRPAARYCNGGSETACVEEKPLFCTDKICALDVAMAPGAVRRIDAHSADQLLVAVSSYELTDETGSNAPTVLRRASGEIVYVPAADARRRRNSARSSARFIVIQFR